MKNSNLWPVTLNGRTEKTIESPTKLFGHRRNKLPTNLLTINSNEIATRAVVFLKCSMYVNVHRQQRKFKVEKKNITNKAVSFRALRPIIRSTSNGVN